MIRFGPLAVRFGFHGVCLSNSLVRVSFIGSSLFLDSLCRFEVTV